MFDFGIADSYPFLEKWKLLKIFLFIYAVCRVLQKVNKELTFISNN